MKHSCLLSILFLASLADASSVAITTPSLLSGTVASPYSATVSASGGCTPYRNWKVSSGALPPGISPSVSSDTKSDVLSGTPSAAGTFNFAISVTGCGGHVSTQAYSVTISSGATPHKVSLVWQPSSTPGVTYNVYRTIISGGYYALIGSPGGTRFIDSSVTSGQTYYYVATAVNSGGESQHSNEVGVVIPNP